jgi:hypothetical protein
MWKPGMARVPAIIWRIASVPTQDRLAGQDYAGVGRPIGHDTVHGPLAAASVAQARSVLSSSRVAAATSTLGWQPARRRNSPPAVRPRNRGIHVSG